MSDTVQEPKVPKLRFREFEGAWNNKRLSSVIQALDAGVSVNSKDRPALPGEKGVLKTSCVTTGEFDRFENKVVSDDFEIDRLKEPVMAGTIIISRMNTPALVGANALIETDHPNLFLPDRLWAAKLSEHADAHFLSQLTASAYFRSRLSARATGTSGSMKNLSKSDVLTLVVQLPDFEEQEVVGAALWAVTRRVRLLRRQRDALEAYKTGMMQRIFRQELRFIRSNGSSFPDWEEGRLGDAFVERSERDGGDAELLSVTLNRGVQRLADIDRTDNSSADKSNYKVVRKGDIAYNSMRMWQGASGLSKFDGIVSPAYTVVTCKTGHVSLFWSYYFKFSELVHRFQRYSQGLTSDTWNLKFPAFSRIKTSMPVDRDEQQMIADFLFALDEKVGAVTKQIDAMQRFKKGLLQQMFV